MHIALINPYHRNVEKQLPLGLAYLASYILKNNDDIEVSALDAMMSTKREISSFLSREYDLVGLSATSLTFRNAIELIKQVKDAHPHTLAVLGGPHVSIMLAQVLEEPLVDFAVYGEGELSFNDTLRSLINNGNRIDTEKFSSIEGVIFRKGGLPVVTPPRELIKDLDSLPRPAFHLFPIVKYPFRYPIITSRGCPFACVFCASSQIWKRRWRARSPVKIIEEIEFIKKKYPQRPIDFQDDGFNMSLKRVNEMCDLLIEREDRVHFGVRGLRADKLNPEVARKMKEAGCTHVGIGVESANPEVLKKIHKGETIEQIRKGVDCLKAARIDVTGQFMIGNPGDTLETVRESIEFAKNAGFARAIFGTAVPFPGTALWDYVEKNGKFLVEKDCTLFGDLDPRVIFETEDFTKEERLEAIGLAREAGMMISSEMSARNKLALLAKEALTNTVYRILPDKFAYLLDQALRKARAKIRSRN